MPQHFFDKIFRDNGGQVVIGQLPNLPILGWLGCTLLGLFFRHGHVHTGLHLLAQAFLFTWAYLEIRSGASPFRRLLGSVVMLLILASFFRPAL